MARSEQIKTERRRRTSNLSGRRRRLPLDETKLDRVNFAYRWANDDGMRIHDLTVNDDWEVVTDRGTMDGVGAETSLQVGVGTNGNLNRAVLLRKPRHLYDDDRKAAQRRIDDTEKGLVAGEVPGADNSGTYGSNLSITTET